jgi:hypothetical protein
VTTYLVRARTNADGTKNRRPLRFPVDFQQHLRQLEAGPLQVPALEVLIDALRQSGTHLPRTHTQSNISNHNQNQTPLTARFGKMIVRRASSGPMTSDQWLVMCRSLKTMTSPGLVTTYAGYVVPSSSCSCKNSLRAEPAVPTYAMVVNAGLANLRLAAPAAPMLGLSQCGRQAGLAMTPASCAKLAPNVPATVKPWAKSKFE